MDMKKEGGELICKAGKHNTFVNSLKNCSIIKVSSGVDCLIYVNSIFIYF